MWGSIEKSIIHRLSMPTKWQPVSTTAKWSSLAPMGAVVLLQCNFFFQAEDGIRDKLVTGVQTCALPISYSTAYATAQPDPGRTVVSVDLEAGPIDWQFIEGVTTRAWGFNGRIPGPTLEATVGDVLEVRLTNRLPEPTTIHWHGLRVPAAMDGTDIVQSPIAPGATFAYRFRVPDAGTFWYHPHSHETVQMERGLYGAIVVRSPNEPTLDADRVLVIDDVKLDHHGQIEPPRGWVERHNGREGSTRLINGRAEPELVMAAGQ